MPPLDHLLALVHWHYQVVHCHYRYRSKLLVGPGMELYMLLLVLLLFPSWLLLLAIEP